MTTSATAKVLKIDATERMPNFVDLAEGGVAEQMAYALDKVADNILDENTNPVTPRKVTLEITLIPNIRRDHVDAKIQVKTKLVDDDAITASLQLGKSHGQVVMIENSTLGE